jgi:hypothetical protein
MSQICCCAAQDESLIENARITCLEFDCGALETRFVCTAVDRAAHTLRKCKHLGWLAVPAGVASE